MGRTYSQRGELQNRGGRGGGFPNRRYKMCGILRDRPRFLSSAKPQVSSAKLLSSLNVFPTSESITRTLCWKYTYTSRQFPRIFAPKTFIFINSRFSDIIHIYITHSRVCHSNITYVTIFFFLFCTRSTLPLLCGLSIYI